MVNKALLAESPKEPGNPFSPLAILDLVTLHASYPIPTLALLYQDSLGGGETDDNGLLTDELSTEGRGVPSLK